MFFRVSTATANVTLTDLGYVVVHPATNEVLSDQFTVEDLQNSKDLEAAIQAGTLTAQVRLDGTWTAVAAVDFTGSDIYAAYANVYEISNKTDNEKLVNGSDASALHNHNTDYYTKLQLGAVTDPSGASLIGVNASDFVNLPTTITNLQEFANEVDDLFSSAITLDTAYTNDSDGIMDVNGTGKNLNLRSNNVNDILISRISGVDQQNAVNFDVSANELILGSAAVGALGEITVRVKKNLIVEGDFVFNGTITDQTVNNMNVTNTRITMSDGAAVGADAWLAVDRGSTGADSVLKWDETAVRWKAGIEGAEQTIALLERNEVVTGIWEFQGGATDPNMYLTNKASAPTTNLGTANQYPVSMIGGILAVYDKTNSRNKFLSVNRQYMYFWGRDSNNNTNEYARAGDFTSNQGGPVLMRNATLVGISAKTNGAETWTVRVRKNGVVTNLASLALSAVDKAQDITLNIDFNAGDDIEVYIDGTRINRPIITLEFAYRF